MIQSQCLLYNSPKVNAKGELYGNALQAASLKGYDKIVQMLLANGAHIEIKTVTPGLGPVALRNLSFATSASGTRVASHASHPQEENESGEAGTINNHSEGPAKVKRKVQRKRKTSTTAEQPATRGLHDPS